MVFTISFSFSSSTFFLPLIFSRIRSKMTMVAFFDGITYDCQHTRNKCISHRCSGNNIKRKYDQDIMKKCKYCTACKADIFETEPDVKKHEDRSYDNCYDSVSSHLIADSSGNILRCDQTCIYIKIFPPMPYSVLLVP